jgi:TolB-like protein/Tfp pilus assembly protein PilF
MRLVSELRRRNVLRMAVLYAVAAWLVFQVVDVMMSVVGLPAWAGRATFAVLAIGFPIALIFSWFYELTPEGISLEKDVDPQESITHVTGRRLDFIVISLLCAGLILFAYDKWWISGPPEQSIAVLPFTNMSADPEQEYFSDGISEELLNVLAQIKPLKVIARTSSFSFKGQNVDIATVAEKLNVRHVLEGSVRRSGNQVRITAQLIDATDSTHVWSQIYDRELDDIFAVQEEIAGAISAALKVELALVAGKAVLPTVIKAANTDAYDAYLQGRELIHRRGQQNLEAAVLHLERALRLDNNFAPAHAQLAIATDLLVQWGGSFSVEEARRTAIPHLDRAQELEPDLAEAHGGRALLASRSDPEAAIEHAKKALASNPSYGDALNWLSVALTTLGRYEELDATLEQILVIDPLTMIGRHNYSWRLSETGQIEEAHQMADQLVADNLRQGYAAHARTSLFYEGEVAEGLSWALKLGGGNGLIIAAFSFVGEYDEARRISEDHWAADAHEGRWDEAIRGTQRNLNQDPDRLYDILNAALVLYLAGRIDEALPLYERSLEFVPEGRPPGTISFHLVLTMHLALARRKAGDEAGAQAAAQIVRQDHAARRAAGRKNPIMDIAEAQLAAFDNDPDHAISSLKSAVQRGLRNRPYTFEDPIFESLQDDSRFIALREELAEILADEHAKVLQLICFNNPVPDDWQPLPETCEGVVEQRRL